MFSSSRISGSLETSHKICSVTLTSTRHADFSRVKDTRHWPRSVWTMTKERWKQQALCLQELSMHLSAPAKYYSTWLSLWSLLIILNKAMQTVTVKAILFLTSEPPEGVSQADNSVVWPFSRQTEISVNRNEITRCLRGNTVRPFQPAFLFLVRSFPLQWYRQADNQQPNLAGIIVC